MTYHFFVMTYHFILAGRKDLYIKLISYYFQLSSSFLAIACHTVFSFISNTLKKFLHILRNLWNVFFLILDKRERKRKFHNPS